MRHRPVALAGILTALVPFVAGCGGGGGSSENASAPLPTSAPKLTVPGENKTPKVAQTPSETTTTTTSTATATTTTPAPAPTQTTTAPATAGTPQGGAAAPQTGGATGGASPDSPQNDTSPPANSPASKFEQFCKENPGAC